MLKQESMVVIADNTQAKKAKVIRILKGSTGDTATIGDRVVVAIKETSPTSSIKKGQVVHAVVVRVKKEISRPDGTYVRFGDNAIVLLTKDAKGNMNPI